MIGKKALVRQIAERTRFPISRVRRVYDEVFDVISEELYAGERVVTPLGSFFLKAETRGDGFDVRFKQSATVKSFVNLHLTDPVSSVWDEDEPEEG